MLVQAEDSSNRKVVLKIADRSKQSDEQVLREAAVMKRLPKANGVVQLLETGTVEWTEALKRDLRLEFEPAMHVLVMEFCVSDALLQCVDI
mgnify:CR=1 FL=1